MTDQQSLNYAIPSVDYFTITTATEQKTADMLHHLFDHIGTEPMTQELAKRWSFKGYHGWNYQGIKYGIRKDEGIVTASGADAAWLLPMLAKYRSNCPRIDLAVTISLAAPDHDVAGRAYASAIDTGRVMVTSIINSLAGRTTYLGSRTSSRFARLYDKGAHIGGQTGIIWRYEVEYKKPVAEEVLATWLSSKDRANLIGGLVFSHFLDRGVEPLYLPEYAVNAIEIPTSEPTVGKTLAWLSKSVRPALGRLIVAGWGREAYEALGLPHPSEKY